MHTLPSLGGIHHVSLLALNVMQTVQFYGDVIFADPDGVLLEIATIESAMGTREDRGCE